jgi:formate dehydrogenase assembly factor FdhD
MERRDSRSAFERVSVTRVGRAGAGHGEDFAATEEPLEVRLHGRPFAVIMRTPGAVGSLPRGSLSESVTPTPRGSSGCPSV